MRLKVSPEAAEFCSRQARGRALVLEFRELSPAGCCSIGASVKIEWQAVARAAADPELASAGDIQGVPVFVHLMLKAFAQENELRVVRRRFGPWKWLALSSDADPAMWCYFGNEPFTTGQPPPR